MESQHYGFGMPINSGVNQPIHWYNSRHEAICDDASFHFTGDKYPDLTPEMKERGACLACVTSLLEVLEKIGKPDGFPDKIVIKVR